VLPLRERSILQAFEGILEVLGTAGDSYLGGDDFDVELAGWIEGQLRQPCSREVRAALATALGRIAAQPW
jgi:molecular chaperone DnaK (HSP70)